MDEPLAQECVRRLICTVLERTGFDAASPDAIVELEDKVYLLLAGLLELAHQYAELARRTRPGVRDLLAACSNQGITLEGVDGLIQQNSALRDQLPRLRTPSSNAKPIRDPAQFFLPDGEDEVARTAPYAPTHLPKLPPAHSYKRTAVFPPIADQEQAATAGMPLASAFAPGGAGGTGDARAGTSGGAHAAQLTLDAEAMTTADARITHLDSRIRTTRLVEASLQSLISATSKSKAARKLTKLEAEGGDEENEAERLASSANANTNVNADEAGQVAAGATRRQTSKEDAVILLERYEKDMAVCNFERDWYGAASAGLASAAAAASQAQGGTGTNAGAGQVGAGAGQRKRGRWRV